MKVCPECYEAHPDTVLTCDCGRDLGGVRADGREGRRYRRPVEGSRGGQQTPPPSTEMIILTIVLGLVLGFVLVALCGSHPDFDTFLRSTWGQ